MIASTLSLNVFDNMKCIIRVVRIYGCFLSNVGQRKASQQQFEAALTIDPRSDVVILSVSYVWTFVWIIPQTLTFQ